MSRTLRQERLGAIPAVGPAPAPRNQVLHGDCIQVMANLPSASVDLVLTDPPYLVNYHDRHGRKVANDNNPAWVGPAFAEIGRVMKPHSFCLSFYGWQATDIFMAAWRAAGLQPVGHLVFAKRYASSSRYLAAQHESAYLLAKGRPQQPVTLLADVRSWFYTGNHLHPTQKPVSALEPLIEAFCPVGGLVLDPFAGSGSTLVAAKALKRDYLGIELDPMHVATARKRLEPGR